MYTTPLQKAGREVEHRDRGVKVTQGNVGCYSFHHKSYKSSVTKCHGDPEFFKWGPKWGPIFIQMGT